GAFLPLLLFIIRLYRTHSSKTYITIIEKLSHFNSMLAESINGIAIIQQFRQEKRLQNEFDEVNDSYFDARYSTTKINALLLSPVINFLYTMAIVVILRLFGYDALSNPVYVGIL